METAATSIISGLERDTSGDKSYSIQTIEYTEDQKRGVLNPYGAIASNARGAGLYDGNNHIISPTEAEAAMGSNYGSALVFERVWIDPLRFDIEFIVEDATRYLRVWNAFKTKTIQLTAVSVVQQTGTDFTYPSLPHTLGRFGDTTYTLTVYAVGPPIQDTIWRFTIDGVQYDIPVTGIRVIAFDLDPNWSDEVQISYEFQTVIFTTPFLKEQRRPLSKSSWIGFSINCDASGDRARKVLNLLSYGHDKVFGMPVYSEKLTVTAATQGTTTIVVSEATTNYYNLNNSSYIILIDHREGIAEVKEISQINANSIDLNQNIGGNFTIGETFVYPCVFCILNAFRSGSITNDFDEVILDFKEYKSG